MSRAEACIAIVKGHLSAALVAFNEYEYLLRAYAAEKESPPAQELPAAAAETLPSECLEQGRDAIKGTSAQQPAQAGDSAVDNLRRALSNTAFCFGDALSCFNELSGKEVFTNAASQAADGSGDSGLTGSGPASAAPLPDSVRWKIGTMFGNSPYAREAEELARLAMREAEAKLAICTAQVDSLAASLRQVEAERDALRQDAKLSESAQELMDVGRDGGLEDAACVVDQCNREGPYNAIGAAARIRALKRPASKERT